MDYKFLIVPQILAKNDWINKVSHHLRTHCCCADLYFPVMNHFLHCLTLSQKIERVPSEET